jgi:hypothetical protein
MFCSVYAYNHNHLHFGLQVNSRKTNAEPHQRGERVASIFGAKVALPVNSQDGSD